MAETKMVQAPDNLWEEADVLLHVRKWRWISCKIGSYQFLAMNWVVTFLASAILLTFVILGALEETSSDLARIFYTEGQSWVTQNFTWLYILTQDVWVIFLIYLACTKYGDLKLGKDNELPRYNNLTWFCMIFCCGIAVGFFLFGVGEPLYYYRQPTYWKSWNYDYNVRKTHVNDDDQRANQSIFICFFHWGVHGWIPYILLAINASIVSHRWGLPMTIRSCFYPLIGEHIYSFLGDLIDSVSMACTTFGVCTSLGLGVFQLSEGLRYMERRYNYGVNVNPDFGINNMIGLIWGITGIATISVVTGLSRGLKYLSLLAMTLCLVILFFCLFADNTTYLMNVFVQNIGYYLQYILQAGFDCEAFQQLAFEFDSSSGNMLWGSGPNDLIARIDGKFGSNVTFSSGDCGKQVNPCTKGEISSALFTMGSALGAYGISAAARNDGLAVLRMFTGATAVPCGTGWNTTHFDERAAELLGVPHYHENEITDDIPSFPSECPTTTFDNQQLWGKCVTYSYDCPRFQALFDSTNRKFMDWWTVFYWGWWVSWGPFVGIFIATISRGRTIRQVILGGFFLPCLFGFLWFAVFGGLAIKMERVAEFVLNVKPDWEHGTIQCEPHYSSSGAPLTDEALKLDSLGYTMLACQPFVTQIYDVMRPYQDFAPALWPLLWVGLLVYFITSSDSGSFVDDLLGASGLSHPPAIQKIYWGCVEGAVASILVASAPDGNFQSVLKGLRAVSLCAGMPLTVLMCLMVPATWRALKYEFKEPDILRAKKFNTQIFDIFECYRPVIETPYSGKALVQLTALFLNLFVPFVGIFKGLSVVPGHKFTAVVLGVLAQLLFLTWFSLQIVQVSVRDSGSMSWVFFIFFIAIVGYTRWQVRQVYDVWGSMVEDMWLGLTLYPFVLAQAQLMAANNGEGAPSYWAEVERAFVLHEKASTSTSAVQIEAKAAEAKPVA